MIRVEKIIFYNRAPFDSLRIDFDENLTILNGINGMGKTTILSYIVDAFYEMAKKGFHNEFEGKENKYYRVESSIFNIDDKKISFV